MLIEATNSATGEKYQAESSSITSSVLDALTDLNFSDENIEQIIDRLDISADAKSIIFSISKLTIRVGKQIVKIGRKIIDFVVDFYQKFKHVAFGALFGAIIGFLISSIPIIGWILGPFLTPLTIAFGMIVGAQLDLNDKKLNDVLNNSIKMFDALKEAPAK